MNEEEIHKALEIIKQPITVNCKEYHYFDQENYDKLVAVYDNCLWFIRNFEQINTTVERVQQENKKLKDKINTYENPEDLTLMFMYCDEKAKDKIKQLKEVIEEVRALHKKFCTKHGIIVFENNELIEFMNDLIDALNKAKENK
jgi:hypothetical protein